MRSYVFSLLPLLFLSTACGNSTTADPEKETTDAGGGADGDVGSCSADPSATSCEVCVNSSCCSEVTACMAFPACANIAQCASECDGDQSCLANCGELYPSAVSSYNELASCNAANCSSECAMPTMTAPTGGNCPAAAGDTSCTTCLKEMCCSEAAACDVNSACAADRQCAASCSDTDCISACNSSYPAGASDYETYLECALTSCESACQ